MTKERWVISDTHFNHGNMLRFLRDDGTPVRPGFTSAEDMDACMIDRWNTVVKPNDLVYHLGDIAIGATIARYLPRLHGRKYLAFGNHDRENLSVYAQHFIQARMWYVVDKTTLCHVPPHLGSLAGRPCIHGHIHYKTIDDPRYYNVSVENIDYTPRNLDELIERLHNVAMA